MQWGTFLFFACCVIVETILVALLFVEPKGVPIEDCPFLFKKHWFWKRFTPPPPFPPPAPPHIYWPIRTLAHSTCTPHAHSDIHALAHPQSACLLMHLLTHSLTRSMAHHPSLDPPTFPTHPCICLSTVGLGTVAYLFRRWPRKTIKT